MWSFFHSWRRMAGCVTLLMACGFTSLWIRSYIVFDQIAVAGMLFISNSGCFVCSWLGWGSDLDIVNWYSETASPFSEDWYFGTDGVRLPFWAISVPLALLSAYLILCKPSTRTEEDTHGDDGAL